ncbi:MAG: hypothetical protein B7Z15_11670 [Rhizobiales bacterium 32-66-8]|nr:MAG: hypothetical protein B7Z15_11670 [Rhizobiales bacterium 32-66-8]
MLSLLCFALVAIPVVTHPLPPLSDYVNHLARMQIIAEGARDPDLARYYSLEWAVIPNLMMDLLVPIIDRVTNVYVAGEIYTLACFALILFGTQLLHRALFGQWSVVPLLAAPLLYNGIFLIGVMNYVFGIGLALVALSCWVLLRASPWRYLVSLLFVGALFFCHLVSVGVYGMGLLAFEIMRLMQTRGAPLRPRLIAFVAAGLPFALVVPLLLKSPTWGLSGENYWEPRGKIDGLEFVINVYFDHVAFALTAIVVAGALWAARHRQLRIHPFLLPLLCVGGVVYLAMPRTVFATYMADQRLPVALAFMVLAAFQVDLHHRLVRHGFVLVLLAAVLVRVAEVQIMWDRLTTWTTAFEQSVSKIDRGARVLVVYADPRSGRDATDLGLVHAACLAIIEKSALVPTVFTVAGKQIMRVRPPYRDFVDTEDGFPPTLEQFLLTADAPSPDTPRYWDLWPEHFDYVYLLFTEPDEMNPDPDRLTPVYDGGRFQLYKVRQPQPPS